MWSGSDDKKVEDVLQFPPDHTALYQVVLFLAVWFVLKRLVFDRFLEALAARHRRTRGALAEAKRLREEAATLRAEHEARMAEVRKEAARAKEEIRRQTEGEERSLLEGARADAEQILADLRSQVAREVAEAKAALEGETGELSERIARTLLGRSS